MVSNSLLKSVKRISTRIVNLSLASIIGFSSLVAATPLLFPASASAAATITVNGTSIQTAIDNAGAGDTILVSGTFGDVNTYTVYSVYQPITIRGVNTGDVKAKVYGTFLLYVDGVTIDNLSISNKGISHPDKNAINLLGKQATITNNDFSLGNGSIGGGVANGVVIWPYGSNPVSLNITGNTFTGYSLIVPDWSSTALFIAEEINATPFTGTPLSTTIVVPNEKLFANGNTYISNNYDYVHQNWNGGSKWFYSRVSNSAGLSDAITNSAAGATILVGAGTYNQQLTVNKAVTITGAGDNATTGTILASSAAGYGINISASDVSLNDIRVNRAGLGGGIQVSGASITSIGFAGITVTGASNPANHLNPPFVGFSVGGGTSLNGLTVAQSHFDGNDIGWYLAKDNANNSTVTNVNVTDTTFSTNLMKGIYAEKLDHALFDRITVTNSGTDATYGFNAGIDINLKWSAYSDITIKNSNVTGSGLMGTASNVLFPVGITVKARDDAPSYASPAASLTGVTLDNVTVSGGVVGVRFGEPTKNNAGPTSVTVKNSSLSGTGGYGLVNETSAGIAAEQNYWGSAAPVFSSIISGSNVNTDPWFVDSLMTTSSDATVLPDSSGNATINNTTSQVVVTSPSQPLNITVASGTNNATINFSSLIEDNTGVLPQTTVNTANGNISIPAATTVTATGGTWDGVINAPTIQPNSSVSVPTSSGNITTIGTVIDVGSDSVSLTFNNAVRLLIPGQANKLVAFVRNGVFTQISNLCSADNQGVGNALPAGGECYVNVDSDMVVWTKHFTTFVTYTQTKAQTYTVVSGDTLSGIGARAGIAWRSIAILNGISAPYTIYPGQVLKLPAGSIAPAAASTPVAQSTTPAAAVLGESSNPQIGTAVSTVVNKPAVVASTAKKANWLNWYWFAAGTAVALLAVIYYIYRAADKKS